MIVKLFTNIAPHYRKYVWLKLLNNLSAQLYFYYGENKKLGIHGIDFEHPDFTNYRDKILKIKNLWIGDRLLIWQSDVIKQCFSADLGIAIFLGNAYCISTWIAAIICKLRGIKVALWGHGLYGNETGAKLFLRKTFYKIADKHIVYSKRSKELLKGQGFKGTDIYVVFNSLNYDLHYNLRKEYRDLDKKEVFPFFTSSNLPVFLFIGRLTNEKNLGLLIKAVEKMNQEAKRFNLIIIGDGPETEKLKHIGKTGIEEEWLKFTGACYDEEIIGKYLATSDLCISPGNIGLTAIHNLSYGTPVCTHDDFSNQGPEVEAIEEGYNGFFFKKNDLDSLIKNIDRWFNQSLDRKIIRKNCYKIIDKYYNPSYQVSVFNRLINDKEPVI